MVTTGNPRIKRVYDPASEDDGERILIDRLWPRGLARADARLDLWLRDIAPSADLRRWFGHRADRWDDFCHRYRDELADHPDMLRDLMDRCDRSTVTLLYGARERRYNHAVVLRDVLRAELAEQARPNEPASPPCWARNDGDDESRDD